MKRAIAGLMVVSLLRYATPATCADHLVSQPLMEGRLAEATHQRTESIETLRCFLSGSTARRAAATVHLNPDSVAARLSALSDQELRDLADRATRLETDPAAGMSRGGKIVLITLGVAAALFLILLIYYATCDCLFE
jgi:hypothetical protein